MTSVHDLGRTSDWSGVRVVVAGFGVSGYAAADNLLFLGAQVTALDESTSEEKAEKATLLETLGATVRLEPGATAVLPDDVDVVVTSPGWTPSAPLLAQAVERGIPVWGEVELAWRLRDPEHPAPWLAVTGTNGKTTTVQMLESILLAAGLRAAAVGNVGRPIVEAVMDPEPTTCWRSSSPASSSTTPTRWRRSRPRCSTSPRTTSTGTTARSAA